jgi:nitrile hydratase
VPSWRDAPHGTARMNGIHDMGGMHGFGRVLALRDEPVFQERWEGRVFGLVQSLGGGNIDAGRHSIEQLDPVAYLADGYYGRWLAAFVRGLEELGALAPGELEARMRAPRKAPVAAARAPREPWTAAAAPYTREIAARPVFSVGAAVVTRNHQPAGHTRLPGYARRRRGVVARVHPAMVFPDDHARGMGENPQYLYNVRFEGSELWGEDAEPGLVVHLDLFESYLERARGGA